jgi:hypothetical protein
LSNFEFLRCSLHIECFLRFFLRCFQSCSRFFNVLSHLARVICCFTFV